MPVFGGHAVRQLVAMHLMIYQERSIPDSLKTNLPVQHRLLLFMISQMRQVRHIRSV